MINFSYLKQTARSNLKFLLAFTAVLCVFVTIMTNVFTPAVMEETQSGIEGTVLANILTGNGTLIGFMSNSFYALMAILFPMVYSIMVGNRLIAEKIDKGYMAGFLSTPVTRAQIAASGAFYLTVSLIIMWGTVSCIGIAAAERFQPGALDVDKFLLLNTGVFLYHFAISGICFFASSLFNTSRNSLLLGAGLPLYFFVMSLIIKLSDSLDYLKYFTLNTLFDTEKILSDNGFEADFAVLGALALILYGTGIIIFCRRDLPL